MRKVSVTAPMSKSHQNTTDAALIERFLRGEEDAATSLYLRYAERILNLANFQTCESLSYQVGSEEIVQTVFRTFFRRASKGQYLAIDGDELWKLLLVIALNKIRKKAGFHKAQKRDYRKSKSMVDSTYTSQLKSKSDETAYSVLRLTVEDLVAGLPERNREVIELRIQGNTLDEISEKTCRSKRTAERILQDFKNQLLASMGDPSGN